MGGGFFQKVDKVLTTVFKYASWISTACLTTVAVLAFLDVILSKITGHGILGATEYITYMLIPIIYLALAHVQMTDGPLRVEMFYKRFGQIGTMVVDILGNLLSVAILGYMTYCGATLVGTMFRLSERSSTASTSFPLWPFALIFTVGLGLLTFTHLWTIVRLFFAQKGDEQR